jgi:hypothetical protein
MIYFMNLFLELLVCLIKNRSLSCDANCREYVLICGGGNPGGDEGPDFSSILSRLTINNELLKDPILKFLIPKLLYI